MAEVYYDNMAVVMKYYGTEEEPLADFPFNFNLLTDFSSRANLTGLTLRSSIGRWLDNMPDGMWPNWVVSNFFFLNAIVTQFGCKRNFIYNFIKI